MANEDLEKRRLARLRAYAINQALARFDPDYPGFQPEDIVASICAYEEEGNIGDVLDKMPDDDRRRALHDPRRRRRRRGPDRRDRAHRFPASRSSSSRSTSATAWPCR